MSTYFVTALCGINLDRYHPPGVQKWLKRSLFPNLFTKYRRILIPVNHVGEHWILIMIDFSVRKVNNFDTTGHMPFADGESPPERVFQYLTELSNSQNNGYNFQTGEAYIIL